MKVLLIAGEFSSYTEVPDDHALRGLPIDIVAPMEPIRINTSLDLSEAPEVKVPDRWRFRYRRQLESWLVEYMLDGVIKA